jgi:hypothetical protein
MKIALPYSNSIKASRQYGFKPKDLVLEANRRLRLLYWTVNCDKL